MSTAIVTVTGWLANDPEIKNTGRTPLASASIAVNRGFDDNKTTTWFRIKGFGQFWSDRFEKLSKGDLVTISGEIELQEYETNGQARSTLVVYPTFMRTLKKSNTSSGNEEESKGRGRSTYNPPKRGRGRSPTGEDLDDEIPF